MATIGEDEFHGNVGVVTLTRSFDEAGMVAFGQLKRGMHSSEAAIPAVVFCQWEKAGVD